MRLELRARRAGKTRAKLVADAVLRASALVRKYPDADTLGTLPVGEGFAARVKQLFAAHQAAGADANDAAADALQQAKQEQLAAAHQARKERGGGDGGGGDGGGEGSGPPSPLGVARQGSEAVETFERWEEIERVAQVRGGKRW